VIKYHAMKMYEEVEIYLHAFLSSVVDGGACSLSHLVPLPIGWEDGWNVGPVWIWWRKEIFLARVGNRIPSLWLCSS
jgi:hypothetical protein